MKKSLQWIAVLFPFLVFSQPANDNICSAQTVSLGVVISGTNINATVEVGEPLPPSGDCSNSFCDDILNGTVWYQFVAPSSGNVSISTCMAGTDTDTELSLWEGSCASISTLNFIAANDDAPGGCSIAIEQFASDYFVSGLNSGTTYYLQIDYYDGSTPNQFDLLIQELTASANDQPCSATLIPMNSSSSGSFSGGTTDVNEPSPVVDINNCETTWCDAGLDNSFWFKFIAPISGVVRINTCSAFTNVDTQLALYSVSNCSNYSTFNLITANDDTPGGCSSGSAEFASTLKACGLVPGQEYFVQIDSYNASQGDFQVSVEALADCSNNVQIQFIHGSADASVSLVDVYVNGNLAANNLAFKTATAFQTFATGASVEIAICPSTSVNANSPLYLGNYSLNDNTKNIFVIKGIKNTSAYDVSVTGGDDFGFFVWDFNFVNTAGNIYFSIFNNVTDRALIDYYFDGNLSDDIPYGFAQGASSVTGNDAVLGVSEFNSTQQLGIFNLPFTQYDGQILTAVTLGFMTPANNNNGEPLSICLFNELGQVECLTNIVADLKEQSNESNFEFFPNPTKGMLTIDLKGESTDMHEVTIKDELGRIIQVFSIVDKLELHTKDLGIEAGIYFIELTVNNNATVKRIVIQE